MDWKKRRIPFLSMIFGINYLKILDLELSLCLGSLEILARSFRKILKALMGIIIYDFDKKNNGENDFNFFLKYLKKKKKY